MPCPCPNESKRDFYVHIFVYIDDIDDIANIGDVLNLQDIDIPVVIIGCC